MSTMQRSSYQLILNKYKSRQKGNEKNMVRLSQSTLTLLQNIDPQQKVYTFPLLSTEGVPNSFETRLNLNDEFISYSVGYFLMLYFSPVGSPNTGSNFLITYPPMELLPSSVGLNEAYNGKMNIDVNGINRLSGWDMLKHKVVPRTQFQNSSPGMPFATQPSFKYGEDGFAVMQPMVTFSGAKKNEVQIVLNVAIPSLPTNSITWLTPNGNMNGDIQRVALMFRGMLAQNAAKFQ